MLLDLGFPFPKIPKIKINLHLNLNNCDIIILTGRENSNKQSFLCMDF